MPDTDAPISSEEHAKANEPGPLIADLALAKRLAWRLRSDVRKNKSSSDLPDAGFEQWWLIQGRAEYPYWSYLPDEARLAFFESAGKFSVGPIEQAVPKVMQLVLARRADVMQKFSVEKGVNVQAVAAWFWLMGLHEHALSYSVPVSWVQALDRPVPIEKRNSGQANSDVPLPTVLMSLAWNLLPAELQTQMNLDDDASRYRYFSWFFAVAKPLFRYDTVLANRWRAWLLQMLPADANNPSLGDLPRFALMEHSFLEDSKKPKLTDVAGVSELQTWAKKVTDPGQKWGWLEESIAYQDNGLPVDPRPIWRPAPIASPRATTEIKKRPFGLNLFGFAFGELGLGEDLRMAVETCKAAKIPYQIVNISPGREIGQSDLALADELGQGPVALRYCINVFCMPGFDVANRIFLRYGNKVFEDFYNIGWWPWELDVWPKAWHEAFGLADEIWSCSQYSDAMYRRSTAIPVTPMPLAASVARTKAYARSHYHLPKQPFLFLYVFDFNSHVERKNPGAAMEAFWQAFGRAPSKTFSKTTVGLVLKVMNSKPQDPKWLAFTKAIESDPRIQLIQTTLERSEVLGLINTCDAYVSPHRAEGFGRTLAEAMLLGKPVIATNYSGNQFFMNPEVTYPVQYRLQAVQTGDYHFIESSDGAQWANPDIADMAKHMMTVFQNRSNRAFAKAIQAYAQSVFAPERTAMLLRNRLAQLVPALRAKGVLLEPTKTEPAKEATKTEPTKTT